MFDESLLPKLKGAPISILLLLSLSNRTMTIGEIKDKTGYSDKTTKAGLLKLHDMGMVTETQRFRYQLTGTEYQLPLYWDEKIEPHGNISDHGNFSDIERRVSALEAAVFRGLPASESGDSPIYSGIFPEPDNQEVTREEMYSGNFPEKYGISPSESGDFPLIEIDGSWKDPEDVELSEMYAGNFPEKYGNIPEENGDFPRPVFNNINNIQKKEVSKYVDAENTYLPDNKNTAVNQLTQPEKIPEAARKIWDAAILQLRWNMGEVSYKTYLAGAVIHGYKGGHYTIGIANKMKRDWCHDRLTISLENILSGMSGEKCSVSFVLDQAAGPKIANWHEAKYEAPSHELLPGSGKLVDICNDYLLDPVGIEYSSDELRKLIDLKPDPDVLRFVLPMATKYENAEVWCRKDLQTAKRILLKKHGIVNGMAEEIVRNDAATLTMIEDVCEELCPENKGAVGDRIRKLTADGRIEL